LDILDTLVFHPNFARANVKKADSGNLSLTIELAHEAAGITSNGDGNSVGNSASNSNGHEEIGPIECPYCPRTFRNKRGVARHLQAAHAEEIAEEEREAARQPA
jgi:hypothetical protein